MTIPNRCNDLRMFRRGAAASVFASAGVCAIGFSISTGNPRPRAAVTIGNRTDGGVPITTPFTRLTTFDPRNSPNDANEIPLVASAALRSATSFGSITTANEISHPLASAAAICARDMPPPPTSANSMDCVFMVCAKA